MLGKLLWVLVALSLVDTVGCGDSNSPSTPTPTPTPAPPSPSSAFGPGTHLVGTDITARRYYSDPRSGCFWERLSGLGGTLAEVITNQFIGFDSRQEIVAIQQSDLAFKTDADCGDWFTSARHGPQTDIQPGRWLVGNQIAPGTYRAMASAGCFWERLRNFSGELSGTIANDFVAGGGSQLVSIDPSDLGFSSDDDCGTWTRAQTLSSSETIAAESPAQSLDEIESNRRMNRERNP